MTASHRADAVRWWLALATVLVVVVSSGVLLVRHLLVVPEGTPPDAPTPSARPQPSPTSAVPTPSPVPGAPQVNAPSAGKRLPGAGAGDVYLQSARSIFRVELATGRVTRTPTPTLEHFSSFVAGPGWVVSKTVDDSSGVVVADGRAANPLPPALQPVGRLHPAPHGDVWVTPEEPTRGARVVRRVGIDGLPVPGETIRLPEELGTLRADGAGYLVSATAGGVYQYRPSGPRRISTGVLIALGARHLLVWDCDRQARCSPYRVTRDGGARTRLRIARAPLLQLYGSDLVEASAYGGDLSPAGTHVALRVPGNRFEEWPLAVLDLATGRTDVLPGSLTGTNGNAQLAWTPGSRWLLAVTDHQLRGYDTRTRTTRTITVTEEPLLHLTITSATGN